MKKIACKKCKKEFEMPDDFTGSIFCEDCETACNCQYAELKRYWGGTDKGITHNRNCPQFHSVKKAVGDNYPKSLTKPLA